jgi:hypothetical protein
VKERKRERQRREERKEEKREKGRERKRKEQQRYYCGTHTHTRTPTYLPAYTRTNSLALHAHLSAYLLTQPAPLSNIHTPPLPPDHPSPLSHLLPYTHLPYGLLLRSSRVGISVARARAAKVSMMRFIHSICTARRGCCSKIAEGVEKGKKRKRKKKGGREGKGRKKRKKMKK